MKIKELIQQKLDNFCKFIIEEISKTNLPQEKINEFYKEIVIYTSDLNVFIQLLISISGFDNETAVKLYLSNHGVEYDNIKDKINNEKLLKYIEMFINIVKK